MANVIMAKRSKFKPERKMLILEDAEVKRLEEAAREKYGTGRPLFVHGNLIVFMLHTGLRCGELLALEWSDIDFESKTVSINKNLAKIKQPKYVEIVEEIPRNSVGKVLMSKVHELYGNVD